jgi:hypothetical protein
MSGSGQIAVDLYDGAYGPTLRIDAQTQEALVAVRELLRGLSEGTAERHELAADGRFALSGVGNMELMVGSGSRGLGLRRTKGLPGGDSIRWVLDRDGWRTLVGLVGGLLQASRPGHQYLTTEGEDDVLVELAYREGPGSP